MAQNNPPKGSGSPFKGKQLGNVGVGSSLGALGGVAKLFGRAKK